MVKQSKRFSPTRRTNPCLGAVVSLGEDSNIFLLVEFLFWLHQVRKHDDDASLMTRQIRDMDREVDESWLNYSFITNPKNILKYIYIF